VQQPRSASVAWPIVVVEGQAPTTSELAQGVPVGTAFESQTGPWVGGLLTQNFHTMPASVPALELDSLLPLPVLVPPPPPPS